MAIIATKCCTFVLNGNTHPSLSPPSLSVSLTLSHSLSLSLTFSFSKSLHVSLSAALFLSLNPPSLSFFFFFRFPFTQNLLLSLSHSFTVTCPPTLYLTLFLVLSDTFLLIFNWECSSGNEGETNCVKGGKEVKMLFVLLFFFCQTTFFTSSK